MKLLHFFCSQFLFVCVFGVISMRVAFYCEEVGCVCVFFFFFHEQFSGFGEFLLKWIKAQSV